MLTRENILALEDLPREEVYVEEWGGSVWVRALNGTELEEFSSLINSGQEGRAAYVALLAVNEKGEPLFTKDDIPALEKKNWKALNKICNAALKFNGFTVDAIDEAGKD